MDFWIGLITGVLVGEFVAFFVIWLAGSRSRAEYLQHSEGDWQ